MNKPAGEFSPPTLKKVAASRFLLSGDMTFATVARLLREGYRRFDGEAAVVVDWSGVQRADSASLALMIEWLRWAGQHDATIEYVNVPARILATAKVCGLEEILPFVAERVAVPGSSTGPAPDRLSAAQKCD